MCILLSPDYSITNSINGLLKIDNKRERLGFLSSPLPSKAHITETHVLIYLYTHRHFHPVERCKSGCYCLVVKSICIIVTM